MVNGTSVVGLSCSAFPASGHKVLPPRLENMLSDRQAGIATFEFRRLATYGWDRRMVRVFSHIRDQLLPVADNIGHDRQLSH